MKIEPCAGPMKAARRSRGLFACVLLALGASSGRAIVMRHDRPDAAYRALGESLPAVGAFGRTGTGTLIAPRAVLTAAHVARAAQSKGLGFTVGGRTLAIAAVSLHPAWHDGGPHDLGVVTLTEPAAATPIPPCAAEPAAGALMILAGWGDGAVGREGERAVELAGESSPVARAARNTLARVEPDWLVFRFDAPPAGDDLEGVSAAGDSGGPALVAGLPTCIAGVSVWGDGHGRGPGSYGSDDGYARVVPERAWILEQARLPAAAGPAD